MSVLYKNDEFMSMEPELFLYNSNDIKTLYYRDYKYNLKQLIKSGVVEYNFLPISNLLMRPYTMKRHWHIHNKTNMSLNTDIFNKLKLGRNIIEIGTYWPTAVITRPDVSQYVVKYGNHRIYSLKLLQAKHELNNNFKIFSFITSEKLLVKFAADEEKYNFSLNKPITVYLNKEILERAKNVKKRFLNLLNIKEIDKYTIQADVNNFYDLWYACHSYALYLRNLLILNNIPPLEELNNESKFQEWIKKC